MRYGVLGSREVVYYCRMGGKSGRVGEKRKEQLAILVRSCLGWAVSTYIKYIRQERGTTNGNRKKNEERATRHREASKEAPVSHPKRLPAVVHFAISRADLPPCHQNPAAGRDNCILVHLSSLPHR